MEPLPEYELVVEALSPVLHNLPPKLIGIDGADGVGKTTLGRFLSWHFNVSLLESDLFATDVVEGTYRLDCLRAAIEHRKRLDRPVILEGIALLRLCEQLNFQPDYLIYVESTDYSGSNGLADGLANYRANFEPAVASNLKVTLRGV